MASVTLDTSVLRAQLFGPHGAVYAYLNRVGLAVESRAKQNLSGHGSAYTAVDTARLRGSIAHRVVDEEGSLTCYVGTNVDYAIYVHNGRRPGARMPPPDALIPWMIHKKIITRQTDPAEAKSIAFLIARSIGRRGIPAKPFLAEALIAARSVV